MNNYSQYNQVDFISKIGRSKIESARKNNEPFTTFFLSLFSKPELTHEDWQHLESKKYCRLNEMQYYERNSDV